MRRIVISAIVALASLVPLMHSATAGGWAAVALDTPLEQVVIGEETTITFRVLAHANPETPMPGMATSFLFLHEDTGFFVAAEGQATADPERYSVTFTLDQEGAWDARAMIHNYADRPLLTSFPDLVAVTAPELARS